MLDIIHSPPEGSEELVTMILQTLTEESNPSANLVVAVKHLYETKLKDASILIPLLSSFPKEEVLPIFPRLVDLSPDRFQDALARILQGSAHTGPALTPAEVLIAIHDINPEKDKVPLKKVIDACTACFEQRTVFTQQVLEKALNKLVDNVPIPLLFMRTVIQALDAFPALVDFVMGILSRLVNKQIWKMPKLWVGFLKLAYQTQPRSFDVLLQLPPPQLEVALNKYPNLRSHLSSFVNRQNLHNKLPRHTLNILGFLNEPQQAPMPFAPAALQTADTTSSLPGANIM
ncbi:symplekin-like [Triticum urartu]|nr:symplekin-like [Triticum urartu]